MWACPHVSLARGRSSQRWRQCRYSFPCRRRTGPALSPQAEDSQGNDDHGGCSAQRDTITKAGRIVFKADQPGAGIEAHGSKQIVCPVDRNFAIVDERPYTINEIVDTVQSVLEQEFGVSCAKRRLRLPAIAGDVARVADGTLQAVGLYNQKIHVLSEMGHTIACSIEKAKAELGYAPTVALREGMLASVRWCLANGLHF